MATDQNGDAQRRLLAVLIDADNIRADIASDIFDEIAGLGEAAVRRVYGDFSSANMNGWNKAFGALALVAHQQHANTKGKNASDIALVIDAMDLMHTGRFDGFVLVSSDSDFTRLASRIREQGLIVYGIGERKTPESFREACNQFIYVENIVDSVQADTPATKSARKVSPPSKAVPIIHRVLAASEADEWMSLGALGQKIRAMKSDFDPRDYGKAKLIDLLKAVGAFEVATTGSVPRVRINPAQAPKPKPASGQAKG
ncbi:NYN domain-containing protein [Abyssibius alkaniclasticus]|uniref:NYN domain-containing protein n=1 Tax=Abyssibius alkaniclasticus TaxID=2881234 RepID=UPI0023638376|nr:NYN domain-containing protein [Abyssibius alkaniclasticus]UPH72358.1 NYN domain-containing protein [Abyssibius alkaniclasticus]|tara:strand:+ start:293 stop:1063 length:771 start_codon:yes stop_codon:yes gene_type:complete